MRVFCKIKNPIIPSTGSSAGVAIHHPANPIPVTLAITVAAAAGFKICRPRTAITYLVAVANIPISASLEIASTVSSGGINKQASISAVIIDDSPCGFTLNNQPTNRPDPYTAATNTTILTSSETNEKAKYPVSDSTPATLNSVAKLSVINRYIVTLESQESNQSFI